MCRPPVLPDIVTMNHAHTTHYTDASRSGHQVRAARLGARTRSRRASTCTYKDVRVRNVPTNIRTFDGGTERHGNSIFIFEIANLCIAHLGHLHHTLTQQQLNEIGRVDVVLVPVDGNFTLDLDGMVEVLHALKAPLMIPMHYFSAYTLDRFLDARAPGMGGGDRRGALDGGVQDQPAGQAESPGAARPLSRCRQRLNIGYGGRLRAANYQQRPLTARNQCVVVAFTDAICEREPRFSA